MITGLILGVLIGGHALKEIARDRNVRVKIQQWADEAGEKAKSNSRK